ncbi:tripartite tricarboxylate transporter TctB family protein [Pelagibacterium mangrovi]|uniref:tripartite tricarboxylate transporter TctB family protein n=1 Tax=Pelagibacterium mangrovi TaxID=3119828 RepID=UPI002FC7DA7E
MSLETDGQEGRLDGSPVQPFAVQAAAGLVFLVIALIGASSLWTNSYLELGQSGSDPGPGFVPWIGVWVLGLGGVVQIILVAARARLAGGFQLSGEFTVSRIWLPVLLVASMIAYQMALRPLGFITASLLFAVPWVALIHWRCGARFTLRHLVQLPLEAVLIVGAIFVVFRYGIQIPFP